MGRTRRGGGHCEVCETVDDVYLTAKRAVDLQEGKHETMNTLAIFRLCTDCARHDSSYTEYYRKDILERNAVMSSDGDAPLDTAVPLVNYKQKTNDGNGIRPSHDSTRINKNNVNTNNTNNNKTNEQKTDINTTTNDDDTNEQKTDDADSNSPSRLSEIATQAVSVRIVFGAEKLKFDRTSLLSYMEKREIVKLVRKHVDIKAPQLALQLEELLWQEQVDEFVSVKSGITVKDLSLLSSIAGYTKIPKMCLSWNKLSGPLVGQALRSMVSPGNIRELDLSWNSLGSAGALHMATALASPSCQLAYLNLSSNKLGPTGTTHIARALRNNKQLQTLNLSFNDMEYTGAAALSEMLTHNRTIQSLNLRNNEIGQRGAEVLAGALRSNMTLRDLIVVDNHIGEEGAVALAQFLRAPVPKLLEHIGGEDFLRRQGEAEAERRRLKQAD